MSNNEEKDVKELKKDYGEVKEKEQESKIAMKKNKEAHTKKTKTTDNEYQKAIDSLDLELEKVRGLYVQKQATQKELYKEKISQIQTQLKELTNKHETAVKKINDGYLKRQSEIKKEAKLLEDEKTEKLAEEDTSLKEQEVLFEETYKEIEDTYEAALKNHQKQSIAVNKDFETQIEDVKKRNIEDINAVTEKTKEEVTKLEQTIQIEQSAKDEKLLIIKEKYDEQSGLIQEKRRKIVEEFDGIMKSLDESIEHKIARHEKFMEKSEKDHDERAVKLHKNEIKNLHKAYDKDLHDLQKNKQSELSKLDLQLDELKNHFIEEKLMLEKSYKKEVESLIYQIELLKAQENYQAEKVEATLDVDLMNVSYRYEEAKVDLEINDLIIHMDKEGSVSKHHADKEIIEAKYEQNKQLILRNYDVGEANNEGAKEIALVEKETDISHLRLDLSIDEASAAFDLETEKHRHSLEKEILCYEEQISHYENDYERQQALKNEYVSYQTMVKSLEQTQLKEIAEYDEAETKNRFRLKISYMESLLPMIHQDKKMLLEKIDRQFSLEGQMYEEQIDLISSARLEEMEEIEKEFDEKIAKVIEKRDQLDPNAYKREIKDYNGEIKNLEQQKEKKLSDKQSDLKTKTALYKEAKKETEDRKENAFKEASAFFDKEEDHIKRTIQMLKDELDKELFNKDSYLQKMKDDALHYQTFTKELANLMDEQNSTYLQRRIDKAKEQIDELRDQFEDELKKRQQDLKEITSKFEELKEETTTKKETEIARIEQDKDQKIAVISTQASKTKERFEQFEKERMDKYKTKIKELHHTVKQKSQTLKQDLVAEHNRLKKTQKEHEKNIKILEKQYGKTKKLIYKKYQASLKKELDTISSRRRAS